jgi:hypothetical protein
MRFALASVILLNVVTSAQAEPVTWAQLVGKKIALSLNQVRRTKVEEDGGVYTNRANWQFEVTPGENGTLKYWRRDTGYWPDWPGHTTPGGSPVQSTSTALGKVHPNPDRLGTAVWSFENGHLTRLSVETDGTKGRTFLIAVSEDLKSCTFTMNEVGQVGAGSKSWVNDKGKKRWLVSLVSQSISCKLSG